MKNLQMQVYKYYRKIQSQDQEKSKNFEQWKYINHLRIDSKLSLVSIFLQSFRMQRIIFNHLFSEELLVRLNTPFFLIFSFRDCINY